MTSINNLSFRRMWHISRLNSHATCRQTAIYAGASIILGLLSAITCHNGSILLTAPFILMAILLMLWLGPLTFATETGVEMRTMLPATAIEKTVFPLIYSFIIIPLAVLLPFAITLIISKGYILECRDIPAFINMSRRCLFTNPMQTFLATATIMATCLWGSTFFMRRRAVKTLLLTFAALLLCGISAIIKIGISMEGLYAQGIIGHQPITVNDNQELYDTITSLVTKAADSIEALSTYRICENVILAVMLAILTWGIYRNIKNRQI